MNTLPSRRDPTAIPRQLRRQGLVRFDFLAGALPRREAPTDIDLAVEKNGRFLFIECKRPGDSIETGQEIFFDALVKLDPDRVRVLVVYGDPPHDIVGYRWWRQERYGADVWDVRDLVAGWREWAVAA